MKNLTWQNPEQLFVAQELINKVKSKCCGIKDKLVKDYATDLGYEYLSASNKEEFLAVIDKFLSPDKTDRPILFEVFTETEDESNALEMLCNIVVDPKYVAKQAIKGAVKQVLGDAGVKAVKKALGK